VVLQEGVELQQVRPSTVECSSVCVPSALVSRFPVRHINCMCSHKKKRMKQIKKMAQRGLLDAENEDPFSLFVASTNIRYCYYSDSHKILGNTFGMCVLQVWYISSAHCFVASSPCPCPVEKCMHAIQWLVCYSCRIQQHRRTPRMMQDFEGLTPNLLARTMEAVEGGGVIVLLLSTLRSLKQLFTLTMDVHARLKTESHQDVRGETLLRCM
jgi:N-acetyltransferase 10